MTAIRGTFRTLVVFVWTADTFIARHIHSLVHPSSTRDGPTLRAVVASSFARATVTSGAISVTAGTVILFSTTVFQYVKFAFGIAVTRVVGSHTLGSWGHCMLRLSHIPSGRNRNWTHNDYGNGAQLQFLSGIVTGAVGVPMRRFDWVGRFICNRAPRHGLVGQWVLDPDVWLHLVLPAVKGGGCRMAHKNHDL